MNKDSALISALQTEMYADGKHCGKSIRITRMKGKNEGAQLTVTVADECPTYVLLYSDRSHTFFAADLGELL